MNFVLWNILPGDYINKYQHTHLMLQEKMQEKKGKEKGLQTPTDGLRVSTQKTYHIDYMLRLSFRLRFLNLTRDPTKIYWPISQIFSANQVREDPFLSA